MPHASLLQQVTDAYRTLVREGRVQSPMANNHREQPPRRRPPTPMVHKTSSESSISVESFAHMVASGSAETLPTPASSKRGSLRSLWGSGKRKADAQRRGNTTGRPHTFSYQPPPRGAGQGPAVYTPPPTFAPMPPMPPPAPKVPKPSRAPPASSNLPNAYAGPSAPPPPKINHRPPV